jgi:hypothetical protein
MERPGIADERHKERLIIHGIIVAVLLTFHTMSLLMADVIELEGAWGIAGLLILLFLGVIVAGYAINLAEDYCTKPRPIHCRFCRAVVPIEGEWRCGYCQAKNSGSPLKQCLRCGCYPRGIACPNRECHQTILLRAPLGHEPTASCVDVEHNNHEYAEQLESHRRQQEIIERDRELAEAQAVLLQAQQKKAIAEQALARAKETPEQTYEREVLNKLQSEGKRRQVIQSLRDEIALEKDEDEQKWKAAVLDRIQRESSEL